MPDTDMTRRQFLQTAAVAACACALCGSAPAPADEVPAGPLDAGKLDDFSSDGVYDQFAKSHHILIIRHDKRLYAPTAICTHKRCTVRAQDQIIVCPCHHSRYSLEGVPIRGPAKRPLIRYAIQLQDNHIIIDPARQFDQTKWDDPLSFIQWP